MPVVKKVAKKPTVYVETKKMTAACSCASSCGRRCHVLVIVLLALNLVFTACMCCMYMKTEYAKVGGWKNYRIVNQIYKTQVYKDQQTQSIQQALQMYQGTAQPAEMDVQDAIIPTE